MINYNVPGAWYRQPVNTWKYFEKIQGRAPFNGEEQEKLAWYASKLRQFIGKGSEVDFEFWWRMMPYYAKNLKHPSGKVRSDMAKQAQITVQSHIDAYHQAHKASIGSFLK